MGLIETCFTVSGLVSLREARELACALSGICAVKRREEGGLGWFSVRICVRSTAWILFVESVVASRENGWLHFEAAGAVFRSVISYSDTLESDHLEREV